MALWLYEDSLSDAAEVIKKRRELGDFQGETCQAMEILLAFHEEVGILVNSGQQDNSQRVSFLQRRVGYAIRGKNPDRVEYQ